MPEKLFAFSEPVIIQQTESNWHIRSEILRQYIGIIFN